MISASSTHHCHVEDCTKSGYCGLLWLKVDSRAFWDWWLASPTSTQCPGPISLATQLFIEFASNVSVAIETSAVIGRCIKIAIQLRLLPSNQAPIRMIMPTLISDGLDVLSGSQSSAMAFAKDSHCLKFTLDTLIPEFTEVKFDNLALKFILLFNDIHFWAFFDFRLVCHLDLL